MRKWKQKISVYVLRPFKMLKDDKCSSQLISSICVLPLAASSFISNSSVAETS
jgi:hypothetical protein